MAGAEFTTTQGNNVSAYLDTMDNDAPTGPEVFVDGGANLLFDDEIETINNRVKPNWLPPNPFLNVGVKARLFFERLRAKSEV